MVYDYFDKYSFLCEMYDEEADMIVEFLLHFFPYDGSIQVIDTTRQKVMIKRVQLPTLRLEMLQIGNIINVFSKLLQITDCVPVTKKTLFNNIESTFAMIKPIAPSEHGKVITFIMKKGFKIAQMKNGRISKDFASDLYKSIAGSNMMPVIIDYITSADVIGLELVKTHAVKEWRTCLGATDPREAAPGTLRQLYGEDILKNVAHGCDNPVDAKDMIEKFFGRENGLPRVPSRATFQSCSCCIIKPHVMIDGNLGCIIELISNSKFYVAAMAMFTVSVSNAEEFFEVYKGVLPEYEAMSIHLAEGKCIALEIKATDPGNDCVTEFRKLCGPRDPEICRQLYPETIRALYGKDTVHNAVHCTDLPEEGELEVEYFFKILANVAAR